MEVSGNKLSGITQGFLGDAAFNSVKGLWFCDQHLAGLAVTCYPKQGVARAQEKVTWQCLGIFSLEASAQLAAQAVTCVHQWG